MPVPNQETAHEALVRICTDIDKSGADGTPEDYAFIRSILQDVVVDSMFQTHEQLQQPIEPADHNSVSAVNRVLGLLEQSGQDAESHELFNLLADQDMQGVIHAHDDIARRNFEDVVDPIVSDTVTSHPQDMNVSNGEPVRIVGVRRKQGEPLGLTVGNESGNDQLTVIRIAPGSAIDKQGLLHVGDIITEVNNVPVHTPDELGNVIRRGGGDVQFRVIPGSSIGPDSSNQRFLRTHFFYDPLKDQKISAPALGLAFNEEDILSVLKDDDKNWWECKNLTTGQTGLIPSPSFEERRRTMPTAAPPDKTKSSLLCGLGGGKKKKKYNVTTPPQDSPAVLYEDVIRVKPFQHRCLVLVGAQGIGRRSIKNRLIQMVPQEFGAPIPNTSRPMREGEVAGKNYHFLSRDEMDADIKAGKYLEFGELRGNYYGTSLFALQSVIDSKRTCIVDAKSAALVKLRTVEWLPYIIFLKPTDLQTVKDMNAQAIADGVDTSRKTDEEIRRILDDTFRIQRQFRHFFDATIPYDNFDSACTKILEMFERANATPQWVPASWAAVTDPLPVADAV